ncbi:MAG: transporter substrate-binding domain-containing protein [Coriobacteriia bacterium]|nr:transporter substrate-binding domain-containing protein [Coriobacteriia bacterium]
MAVQAKHTVCLRGAAAVALACVLACALLALAACAPAAPAAPEEETPQETFVLKVGFNPDNAPFSFAAEDGSYVGLDLDLAQAVAYKEGWDVEYVPLENWDAREEALASGQVNCLWSGVLREYYNDACVYSKPYMLNEQVIVIRKMSVYTSAASLAGRAVAVLPGTAAYQVLAGPKANYAATFSQLVLAESYDDAFAKLLASEVHGVVCDSAAARIWITGNPGSLKRLAVLSEDYYAVAFAAGEDQLAKTVSDDLAFLNRDGTARQLCEKYSKYGVFYDNWLA